MSTLLIDDQAARAREQQLLTTQTDFDALTPGTFEGLPSGLGQAASRAGAGVFALGADLLPYSPQGVLIRAFDAVSGTDRLGQNKDLAADWLNASRLDPATHGSVANILHGVGSMAPAIAASFLNPFFGAAVAGGTTFEGSNSDLQAAGVDPSTAHAAAGTDAALAALGALLPGAFGGNKALNTLAIGPGVNVAQDIVSRYATASLLEANGYEEMAEQYRHMDASTLIADVLIGGAFGYVGAKGNRMQTDAALVQQQIRAQLLAGPGLPVDAASQAKHIAALAKATEDLMAGRPVDVTGIEGAAFIRDPQQAFAAVLERNGYHEEAAQIREIEAQLAERGIVLPDEDDLPAVPRVVAEGELAGTAPKAKAAAKPEKAAGPTREPLPPHEQAAVHSAESIIAEGRTRAKTAPKGAGEGQAAHAVIATPDGEVRADLALGRAEKHLERTETEALQFDAAVNCFLRHGA